MAKNVNHPRLKYFDYEHLPEHLQVPSKVIHDAIGRMSSVPGVQDYDEYAVGMRKLLEAKDCFVRAFVPE